MAGLRRGKGAPRRELAKSRPGAVHIPPSGPQATRASSSGWVRGGRKTSQSLVFQRVRIYWLPSVISQALLCDIFLTTYLEHH